MWPVQHANGAEHGSASGPASQPRELPELLAELIAQMSALTHALYEMAQSNMALVEAMGQAEAAEDDEAIPQAMSRKR